MSNDHIAIPKFIQNGFAKSGMVFSWDYRLKKIRKSPIKKLGTEVDYYDEDVEKDILANGIENEFSKLYAQIVSTTNIDAIIENIDNNKELIAQFLSFLYMRAKKIVKDINKNSLSVKLFGEIDHSALLRIQSRIQVNPLDMIGKSYKILPIINFSKQNFIDNSIGFGISITKNNFALFFMPLNTRLGLIFCNNEFSEGKEMFYINPKDEKAVRRLNQILVRFEEEYGNGFIFGLNKDDLKNSI